MEVPHISKFGMPVTVYVEKEIIVQVDSGP